jgi:hypothetical protein
MRIAYNATAQHGKWHLPEARTCMPLPVLQLAVEDHRWWWRSFLCGGSTAFFILGYCFFYYHYR